MIHLLHCTPPCIDYTSSLWHWKFNYTVIYNYVIPNHIYYLTTICLGLPWWLSGKESAFHCRRPRFDPCVRKIPWKRKWQPTPVFLLEEIQWTEEPGESMGSKKSQPQHNPKLYYCNLHTTSTLPLSVLSVATVTATIPRETELLILGQALVMLDVNREGGCREG